MRSLSDKSGVTGYPFLQRTRTASLHPLRLAYRTAPLPRQKPFQSSTGKEPELSGFFRTKTIPFSSIASRAHWERVRDTDLSLNAGGCAEPGRCELRLARFKALLDGNRDTRFYDKLTLVNNLVNAQIEYKEDDVAYGKLDYWAPAQETLGRGFGDCEDFAIAKFTLLRKLGVPAKSMSLVILRDTSRNLYHAVLAVSTSKGHFILDNVRNGVYQDTQISHYQPLYSFSAERSWIHGKPVREGEAPAEAILNLASVTPGKSASNCGSIVAPGWEIVQDLEPVAFETPSAN